MTARRSSSTSGSTTLADRYPDDWGLLDPLAGEVAGLTDDTAVLHAIVETETVLTLAWHDAEFAPTWVGELDFTGVSLDRAAIAVGTRAGGNPVIPLVGQLRAFAETQHEGAGNWVHRGATSQDILDTALMLVASRAAAAIADHLHAAGAALVCLADEHRASIMVGRTLTQHAAPITFGVKVAGWLDGVDAACVVLESSVFPAQMAGSVGIGSAFAELAGTADAGGRLRAAVAARLALADPGRSWQSERSPVVRVASALALVVGALGRIADDILVLARSEIGELTDASAGASSALPQKRNPTTAVLLRSAALQVPGLLSTLQLAMVTADERGAGQWHSEWPSFGTVMRLATESAAASVTLVESLVVDVGRMAANLDLDGGLAWAEHAQSQLVSDLGLEAAGALVARAVGAVSSERSFGTALAVELEGRVVDLSPDRIIAASDIVIDAALERHATIAREVRLCQCP